MIENLKKKHGLLVEKTKSKKYKTFDKPNYEKRSIDAFQEKMNRHCDQIFTLILTKKQRDSSMGVGTSRKSMVGFEGLWNHNIF